MSAMTASRVPKYERGQRPDPQPFDHCLRYWVWSHTEPGVKYLTQLDSYRFNGQCTCKAFTVGLEKFLLRGVTPEQAVDEGWVKLKERQRPADVLRCKHLVDAFMQFAVDAAKEVIAHEKKQTTGTEDPY